MISLTLTLSQRERELAAAESNNSLSQRERKLDAAESNNSLSRLRERARVWALLNKPVRRAQQQIFPPS